MGMQMGGMRGTYLGASVIALAAASTPVLAQETVGAPATQVASDEDGQETEIIVTAQKREERLLDVPISISVLDGEELDESTFETVTDALRTVPGIDTSVGLFGGGVTISMRGVSNATDRAGGAGVVAYYIDGVPYGFVRSAFLPASPNIFDLSQIEVLRGPQGTLYGANALNGVIRIRTNNANPDAFGATARASVSTTEHGGENFGGDAAINVPIIDGVLAARAVVGYNDGSGWIDSPVRDDINDTKQQSYRFKLRAEPTDTLSIDLGVWRSHRTTGAPSYSNKDRTVTALRDQPSLDEFWAYSGEINKSFPGVSVQSVTSYLDFNSFGTVDGSPAGAQATLVSAFQAKTFTQEVNLVSSLEGPFHWSAGGMYRRARETLLQLLNGFNGVTTIQNDYDDRSDSYAIFGDIGYRFGELELSGGLRYFRDKAVLQINRRGSLQSTVPFTPFETVSDAVTPRVILTWKPNTNQMAYASYSQGFRSGFTQQPNVQQLFPDFTAVQPDRLTNYEVGLKGAGLDGRFRYEAAVFYIDWKDIQQNLSVNLGNGTVTTATINGQAASGFGAEASFSVEPFDGVDIGLTASWNDLTLDGDIVNAAGTILLRKGDRLSQSPEFTFGSSAQYRFGLGGGGLKGRVAVTADYKTAQITASSTGRLTSEPIFMAGGRFSIDSPKGWTATLFVDNLTDENRSPTAASVPQWSQRYRPRTIGLQLGFRY